MWFIEKKEENIRETQSRGRNKKKREGKTKTDRDGQKQIEKQTDR